MHRLNDPKASERARAREPRPRSLSASVAGHKRRQHLAGLAGWTGLSYVIVMSWVSCGSDPRAPRAMPCLPLSIFS